MMKQFFLANERTYPRAVEPEDSDIMYEMEDDPSMWDIGSFTVPYSRFVLKQYIEGLQSDMFVDKQLRLMIMRRNDNRALGTVDIIDFVSLYPRETVGIAAHRNYRQERYATDALKPLYEYVFDFLFVKQLYAHIATDDEISL